ncbi:hypothetical protein [Phenylobacterium aquaticum]|uniref:hypothetical protein n=1 Tax=Phenylobacterium aquaticum TaxID=1763816 RepID=UPI001F5DD6EA|nr:hypothetical protein [Phenylobacterium aquaticum]MCI3134628.1 hypothetical protein [Phenylobacterium aquaticum]
MGRLAGLVAALLGVVLLVYMALVNYADGPQWDRALVAIGMPLSYLLTLAGALLFGLGVWLLFRRRPAR